MSVRHLNAGWSYVSDLAGSAVFDHGREIGMIEDVQFGAGEAPLLIVGAAKRSFEIPFAEAYLEGVDLARRQVRMNLPEGLLEVNAPVTAEEKQEQAQSERKKKRRARGREEKFHPVCTLCPLWLRFWGFLGSAMKADILTIFPDFFRGPLDHGITRRAGEMGLAKFKSTTCGSLRTTGTAPWMTALSAAAKAWC